MSAYQEEEAQRAAEVAADAERRERMTAGEATVPCRDCGQLVVHQVTTTGWATSRPHVAGGRVCVRVIRYAVGR